MLSKIAFQYSVYSLILVTCTTVLSCQTEEKVQVFEPTFFDKAHQKVWKHRVNSVSDAIAYSPIFGGLEVDMVYDEATNQFFCNHDSAVDPPKLSAIFEALANNDSIHYWLDFKSANRGNVSAEKSVLALNQLLNRYQIKNRCIIETFNRSFLKILRQQHFYTSFWVSKYKTESMSASEIETVINKLNSVIDEVKPSALSAHYTMHNFLTANFNVENLHYWMPGSQAKKDSATVFDLLTNPQTKIVLVDQEMP